MSEDRFTGVSRRRRIVCASLSGGIVALLAFIVILGVDPQVILSSSRG